MGGIRQAGAAAVYRDIWNAFTAWCASQSLTPRHALRLKRLIDRVPRRHAAQSGITPDAVALDWIAAHPKVRFADSATADSLPEYLSVSGSAEKFKIGSTAVEVEV